jgi:hypothetical protein
MRHIRTYKLVATYKMTLMYFLVNIHINNQSTLYKVNGVLGEAHWKATIHVYYLKKFQKIQKFIEFPTACPKTQKAVLALLIL